VPTTTTWNGGSISASLVSRWSPLVLVLYLRQWARLRTSDEWTRSRFLQVAAGISLLLLALHELVDYNLYVPANQLVFAVLAGIFFMPVEKLHACGGQPAASQAKHIRFGVAAHAKPRAHPQVAPDQIENPFRATSESEKRSITQ
jgi:hypothetical protein